MSTFLGIKLGQTTREGLKGYWVEEWSKHSELGVRRELWVTRWSEKKDEWGKNEKIEERTEWDREGNKTFYYVRDKGEGKTIIDEEY